MAHYWFVNHNLYKVLFRHNRATTTQLCVAHTVPATVQVLYGLTVVTVQSIVQSGAYCTCYCTEQWVLYQVVHTIPAANRREEDCRTAMRPGLGFSTDTAVSLGFLPRVLSEEHVYKTWNKVCIQFAFPLILNALHFKLNFDFYIASQWQKSKWERTY